MALRHLREPEGQITPEEARAFLQVHAEREAGGADGPRVEDLAETLHLPVEEARAILREARTRVAVTRVVPKQTRWEKVFRGFLLAIPATTIVLVCGGILATSFGPEEPEVVAAPVRVKVAKPLSHDVTPPVGFETSSGSVPVGMVEPPPAGFEVEIDTPNGLLASPFNRRAEGVPLHLAEPDWAAVQREGLARTAEGLLANGTDERGLSGLPSVSVYVRVQNGGRTRLVVPMPAFTPPLRNDPQARTDFRAALVKVLEAAWPGMIDATPR